MTITTVQDFTLSDVSTPTTPKVTVAVDYDSSATSFTTSSQLKKSDGTAITGKAIIGVKQSNGFVEEMYIADGSTQIVGTTITPTTRGVKKGGLDITTSDSSLIPDLTKAGAEVYLVVSGIILEQMQSFIQGAIGSGNPTLKIGDGTTSATQGFEIDQGISSSTTKYGADASGNPLITLPGGSSFIPGAGAGSISGGDGIDFTASVISVDLAASNDLQKFTAGELDTNLTATKTEIDQLSGTTNIAEANTFFGATDITGAEAETLSDGSNADNLHTHSIAVIDGDWVETSVGTGSSTRSGLYMNINSSSTVGHGHTVSAILPDINGVTPSGLNGMNFTDLSNGDIIDLTFRIAIPSTASFICGFSQSNDFVTNKDATIQKAFFKFDGTTLESSTSQGTTEEDQTVSGVTVAQMNTYRIRWTVGTDVKFYVNGTLKNTHTTQIPNNSGSGTINIGAAVQTTDASNRDIYVDRNVIAIYPK